MGEVEEEEEDGRERKKWEKWEKIGERSSVFHLFFLFLLGTGYVPTMSRRVRHFSKNKKSLEHACNHVQCIYRVSCMLDPSMVVQMLCPCFPVTQLLFLGF